MPETRTLGVHRGISFPAYLAIEAVNNTTLKLFDRTPAHAHWDMTHPKDDTAALRMGDACHVAILEPERFEREYVLAPKFDRRTNKGKADATAWAEEHPDQAALLPDEWEMATAMRDAVHLHSIASALLGGPGQNEMTAIWKDEPTGLLCKGRIDRLTSYQDGTTVVDVKTARDGSVDGFSKACADYQYHQQAAFYLDGLNVIAPHPRRFIHLVVENTPPHCVSVLELDDTAIEEGRRCYRRALDLYAECTRTGVWPGYPVGIEGFDIPKWAYRLGPAPK
jgi:exodeoxyribonuclease VIII